MRFRIFFRSMQYGKQILVRQVITVRCLWCPKIDGGWRPIINLKSLNSYLFTPHFKLENIQSLKDVLLQNDFMVKVDLKDAYLTVPMHHSAYKYL